VSLFMDSQGQHFKCYLTQVNVAECIGPSEPQQLWREDAPWSEQQHQQQQQQPIRLEVSRVTNTTPTATTTTYQT
jgi:hypothetical protein